MKRVVFALFLAVFAVGAAQAGYVACSSCAKTDWFDGDASCTLDLQDQCGSRYSSCVIDEDDGTVYCDGEPGGSTTCTCPSGYSGTCTGTNYSTCYKSCSAACTENDVATCNSYNGSGGGYFECSADSTYIQSSTCSGRQYYGSSTCYPSTTNGVCYCPVDVNAAWAECPSGYTDGGQYYNTDKYGGPEEACYYTYSNTCSGNNTSACPSNATCSYNTSYKYSGNCYYGESCATSGKCPVSSFSCSGGYYKSGSSCSRCPQHSSSGTYGSSSSGSTSSTSCYIGTGTSWSFSDTKGSGNAKFSSTCYYSN